MLTQETLARIKNNAQCSLTDPDLGQMAQDVLYLLDMVKGSKEVITALVANPKDAPVIMEACQEKFPAFYYFLKEKGSI